MTTSHENQELDPGQPQLDSKLIKAEHQKVICLLFPHRGTWRQRRKLFVFFSSLPLNSLRSEALHTVFSAVTATHAGRESLVVQMVSADELAITVPTITNAEQAKCVTMAATVCQCAQRRCRLPFQAIQLFGPEMLLPLL